MSEAIQAKWPGVALRIAALVGLAIGLVIGSMRMAYMAPERDQLLMFWGLGCAGVGLLLVYVGFASRSIPWYWILVGLAGVAAIFVSDILTVSMDFIMIGMQWGAWRSIRY